MTDAVIDMPAEVTDNVDQTHTNPSDTPATDALVDGVVAAATEAAAVTTITSEEETKEGVVALKTKDPPMADPALLNVPFDQLPKREKTAEELKFLKENTKEEGKMILMSNVITFKDNSQLLFRFDTSLLVICKDDVRFCMAVHGAMMWDSSALVKKYMLEYIKKDFDPGVEEVHIFGKGRVDEPDTCIIMNPKDDKQLLWIKFLRQKITDEMWKELNVARGGKDTVILNRTETFEEDKLNENINAIKCLSGS